MTKVRKKQTKKTSPEKSEVTIQRSLEAQIFDSNFLYEAQIIALYQENIDASNRVTEMIKEIIGENIMLYPYYPEEPYKRQRMEFVNQELQPIYDKLIKLYSEAEAEMCHYKSIIKSYGLI